SSHSKSHSVHKTINKNGTSTAQNVSALQLILREVTTLKHCLQCFSISKRFTEQAEHISASIQSAENHIMERIMGLLTDQVGNLAGVVEQLNQRVAQLEEKLSRRGDQLEGDVEGVPALMVKVNQLEASEAAQANADIVSELRIHGVPFQEGKNLKTVFNTLCFALNITPALKL
ncbi:hypothetical protein KR084_005143, partial [Drosophila pseudotakahashii]